jgi:hypothetical protein
MSLKRSVRGFAGQTSTSGPRERARRRPGLFNSLASHGAVLSAARVPAEAVCVPCRRGRFRDGDTATDADASVWTRPGQLWASISPRLGRRLGLRMGCFEFVAGPWLGQPLTCISYYMFNV